MAIRRNKRDGHTMLRSDSTGESISIWRFWEIHTEILVLLFLVTSKREFSQVTTATSGPSKKFSMASHDMKFVFVSFLMIIPISQSKRGSRTTLHSDSTGAITSKWRFLKFLYHEYILPYARYSKREFSQVTIATSGPSKKFSVAFHDMKYVFARFLMIIPIFQSKRGGRTTLRSDSTGGYESKW